MGFFPRGGFTAPVPSAFPAAPTSPPLPVLFGASGFFFPFPPDPFPGFDGPLGVFVPPGDLPFPPG